MQKVESIPSVSYREALVVWWRIGVLSFGGPAGQIALMHRVLVDEKGWLDERRFLHALNYCMLLPGPEAQQLATYVGWLLHGVRGGLTAGLLFILPGALAILALSWTYVSFGDLAPIAGLFFGLKGAVLAIVFQALLRISGRALNGKKELLLAGFSFIGLFLFDLPFPLVVLGAAAIGYATHRGAVDERGLLDDDIAPATRRGAAGAAVVCLTLWIGTLGTLVLALGRDHVFTQIGFFFSKLAVVTFGGAYAVLAYVAQQGVENYGWLAAGEMLDGLGLAETTPGPLILVTQFVGFVGAYRQVAGEPSLLAATAGALLTTWVTFLPCFVWIFAGAPYVERLRSHHALSAALGAITAAVVGVIANLALWFALHILFAQHEAITAFGMTLLLPQPNTLQWAMLLVVAVSFGLTFIARAGIPLVLGVGAALGVLIQLAR